MSTNSLASPAANAALEQRVASPAMARLATLEWAAVAALLAVGALLRVPNLQNLPKLTDEMRDAIFSQPIYLGQSFPLANFSSYDGALFNYLEALLFRLVGPNLQAPRILMLAAGLLTLPLAFLCARRAHGAAAGLLATAMLAVSPVHVLVNSRVAWGNCLTPLLTTAGFWLVYRAVKAANEARSGLDRAWNLVPAGFLFGLALQTHPTVLGFLPGAAAALVMARPGVLLSRWPWLAGLGFLLGYANMIVFNLQNDFESIRFAQQTRAEYTGAMPDFGRDYLSHLGTLLAGLFRIIGGAVEDRASLGAFLFDPLLLFAVAVALAGLIWTARRGDRLPLLTVASAVLLLPLVNDRYEPVLDGRYLAPLLPLIFAAAAGMLIDLWSGAAPRLRGRAVRALCALGAAAVLLLPLLGLARYSEQNVAAALRSARLWTALELAERSLPSGTEAVVDRDLERVVLGAGSTELLAFEYAFTMHQVPYRIVRVTPGGLAARMESLPAGTRWLVVMERAKRKLFDPRLKARQLDLEAVEGDVQPSVYGVYLVRWEAGG